MAPDRAAALTSLDLLAGPGPERAVVAAGQPLDPETLRAGLARVGQALELPEKCLVAVQRPRASPGGLIGYLAALRHGHTVCLFDGVNDRRVGALTTAFDPDVLIRPEAGPLGSGWHRAIDEPGLVLDVRAGRPAPLHPQLGLLMWSSGSTGAPKAVRLSYDNLLVNARAIAQATGIDRTDRVATSLPLDFTFGLSLVNSHLVAGACVALTEALPSSERFWYDVDAAGATTVGVVPATARNLIARRWSPQAHPAVRRLLLSGGSLPADDVRELGRRMRDAGGELLSMYGQAEATARITVLPAELLAEHPDSVGRPVPGMQVRVVDETGQPMPDGRSGEICVAGPHVMLGYARGRADLATGDSCAGWLRTGDRGFRRDGLLHLQGRIDRHAKVLGRGVDLDQAERHLQALAGGEAAAVTRGDVVVLLSTATVPGEVVGRLAEQLDLPPAVLSVRPAATIPRTGSGKIDYVAVAEQVAG